MKLRLLLILLCLLPACTVIRGDATKGTYTYASVGGDVKEYAQTAQGVTAASIDNSTSFRDATSTLRTGLYMAAAKAVVGSLSKGATSVLKSKEATTRAANAGHEATKQAAIAADVTKATFVPPLPP